MKGVGRRTGKSVDKTNVNDVRSPVDHGGGRVVRWCWVNFQCRGVLQFGLQ